MATRYGSAVVTLPSEREILITRSFEAPLERVWDAVTMPEHVKRWWGSEQSPLVVCEIDLRVGGSWRYVARDDDGTEYGWHGTYREIEIERRVVSTEMFEGFPDAESVNTMTLRHAEGVTTLQTRVLHASREYRDGHLASGMEPGMQAAFDSLDDVVTGATAASAKS